jgi:hypothetical protein
MKISVEELSKNVHGYTHRLLLDNFYQDLTYDDLRKLKKAADVALTIFPPKRGKK